MAADLPAAPVLGAAAMRAAEAALNAKGIDNHELMRRAGQGAAAWVRRVAGTAPALVLCGPGNNGGDGYVIAEALRRWGLPVTVAAAGEPRGEVAAAARDAYGGTVAPAADAPPAPVLVDCLFGYGLDRPVAGRLHDTLMRLAGGARLRIAIDLPSGIAADDPVPLSAVPGFDLTLALGAWKPAHWLQPAAAHMGRRRLVCIGIDPQDHPVRLAARPRIPEPEPDAHKYRRGLVLVLAGAMPGAALLAARGAQGAGAGYVKLARPDAAAGPPVPPDIVVLAETAAAHALDDPRTGCVVVGPGLGRGDDAQRLLERALGASRALLIDADALHLLAPADLAGRAAPTVLTPHDGEAAMLARAAKLELPCSRLGAARMLASAYGATVLLKGADTVIADPGGGARLTPPASGWLSVAGTGDVLAGAVAARLAAGCAPLDAAAQGQWLHARAARIAGPGFHATALAEALPRALAECA